MSRAPIRFDPPPVRIGPEAWWALLRAFGPTEAPFDQALEPGRVVSVARQLEVSARIAARLGRQRLGREVSPQAAEQLVEDRRHNALTTLTRLAAARALAERAAPRGVQLVPLKFLALHHRGVLLPGSRHASDIDLLAAEGDLESLAGMAAELGFRGRDLPALDHHLPTLDHPSLGLLEIHRLLPGITAAGRAPATLDDLASAGLLERTAQLPGNCLLPSRELLAAHAVAHGMHQHGANPAAYAPAKMLGDLIDLGAADGEQGAQLVRRAAALLAGDVSGVEAQAAFELAGLLGRGAAAEEWNSSLASIALLRHWLAALVDPGYRERLAWHDLRQGLRRKRPIGRLALVRSTLFPSREQLAKIHGLPAASGRLGWLRLARPFQLIGRALRLVRRRPKPVRGPEREL